MLLEIRAKIEQLRPSLAKTTYREGLMELKAPQAGTVKDLATTTEGAVVQPGSVVLTLVPLGEPLFADVAVKNEDIGFVQVGQSAQVKLAAYPFQKYGLLTGKVVHVSADATEVNSQGGGNGNAGGGSPSSAANPASQVGHLQSSHRVRAATPHQPRREKAASRRWHAGRRRNPPGPAHRAGIPAEPGRQGGARGGEREMTNSKNDSCLRSIYLGYSHKTPSKCHGYIHRSIACLTTC